jgi:branched-chain amino acid transport system substrate-binding protein
MTGPLKDYGTVNLEAADMAVAEVNRDGGLLVHGTRHRVVLVVRDGQNRAEPAMSAAQELFNRENVGALIGPSLSGQALPVARLADKAGIPMITQIATNPEVTRGTRYVFRTCCTDDFQGGAMARFAYDELGSRRAAVLYDVASVYGRGIAGFFRQEFAGRGGRVVAAETYTTGATDFRDALRRIARACPDVILLPNYPDEIGRQMQQIHEVGITARVLGSDTMDFWNWDGRSLQAMEGSFFSAHFSPDAPSSRAAIFCSAYRAAYRHFPKQGAALTYDAFALLFAAARSSAGISPADIRDGLAAIRGFEGVTGIMSFNGSPDPRKSVVIMGVHGGEPRFVRRIDP